MKIVVFNHIVPAKYMETLNSTCSGDYYNKQLNEIISTLLDLDIRFRFVDKYCDIMQILTLGAPPIEAVAELKQSAELAHIANDKMAE